MRHAVVLLILFLSPLLPAWEKQGTVLGNITDMEVITWDGNDALVYAATDGAGVFRCTDGATWTAVNGTGSSILPDLHIKAIASLPGWPDYLVAVTNHGVYRTADLGDTWTTMDSAGNLPSDFPFEDIAVASYSGSLYYYLATYGGGVYRRIAGGAWFAYGQGMDSGDTYVISIGANEDRVLAGTQRSLYWRCVSGSSWTKYTDPGFPIPASVPAISYRHPEYAVIALGMMPVGGAYGGLWYASGWTCPTKPTFSALDPSGDMPQDEEFISIDYFFQNPVYEGVAGTRDHLYRIPKPEAATGNYTALNYRGPVKAAGLGRGGTSPRYQDVLFGGPGKGPFWAEVDNPAQRPTAFRSGMQDAQVSDIAVSSQYSVSLDWDVFAASNINGVYKNQEEFDAQSGRQGYFTRMIGAPAYDGVPHVNCLAISPVFERGGTMEGKELILFAGTEGEGVLRTSDGGRSWFDPDFASSKPLPPGARVKALAISPNYLNDQTVFAAVIGSDSAVTGVYKSTNGGLDWNILPSTPPLPNLNVTSLALHPNFPTAGNLYLGCGTSGGFNTVWTHNGAAWSAVGTITHPVTALVTGLYSGDPRIFIGTEDDGVYYYGGSAWAEYNNTVTDARWIGDLAASPNFGASTDRMLIASVRPTSATASGGFCYGKFIPGSPGWAAYNTGLPPDRQVSAVAFAPNYAANSIIFCGHAQMGMYTTRMDPGSPPSYSWKGSSGFFTTPRRINGVAADPVNPEIVLAATEDMGVMISLDGGYTFRPWSRSLTYVGSDFNTRPVPRILSVAVTVPTSGTVRRAVCGTGIGDSESAGHGMYYVNYDPAAADLTNNFYYPSWTASIVPGPVPPTYGNITELRLSGRTLLNENFEGTWPVTGWGIGNGGYGGKLLTWTNANPASVGCPLIPVNSPLSGKVAAMDSLCDGTPTGSPAQNDALYSPLIDLTGVTSLTLEYDNHFSWRSGYGNESGRVYAYNQSTSDWILYKTYSGSSSGPAHETISIALPLGTYTQFLFWYYDDLGNDDFWAVDNVKVIVDRLDMDASDTSLGSFHSTNGGMTWAAVTGTPAGSGMTDIAIDDQNTFPWGRAITGFTWGCSSGKSATPAYRDLYCSNNGKAWQYNPALLAWSAKPTTGLDVCEDFRAILKHSNGTTVLLGSKGIGGGGTTWKGLYRSDDSGTTWSVSNEGLPANPQVWALQEQANGDLLVGVDGGAGTGDVYLSDPASLGRAWVNTGLSVATTAPGTVELAGGGGTVYTGMSSDGIYATGSTISFTGTPTAYFTVASQACVNTSVPFSDYSAGRVTGWTWNFGDSGTSTLQNPSHTYTTAATYYPQLTVSNGYGGDSYTLPNPGLQVKPELEASIRLRKYASLFSAGFESGTDSFTATGLWHRSNTCRHLSYDFYYGQETPLCHYSTGLTNSGTLTSPSISLVGQSAPLTLSFEYLLQTENFAPYDIAAVDISTNGGSSWTNLARDAANSGTLVIDNAWHTASISLSAYAGNTILIRFTFDTVDGSSNYYQGFRVDNIRVVNANGLEAYWQDMASDSGSQIYVSNSPSSRSAYGGVQPACNAVECAATLPNTYAYFRIQIKGTGYVCNDGPIGGTW